MFEIIPRSFKVSLILIDDMNMVQAVLTKFKLLFEKNVKWIMHFGK